MNFKLAYSKGSNAGTAMYLEEYDDKGEMQGGHRICGGKCWGYVNPIHTFNLTQNDLENSIEEFKRALRVLKKHSKKEKSK
jgi:hypothetical protein